MTFLRGGSSMNPMSKNARNTIGTYTWKNPYLAQRKENKKQRIPHADIQHTKSEDAVRNHTNTTGTQDLSQLISQFREGVKGISTSVQQFEKTIDSLTQLYQTIEQLGGFNKVPQWLQTGERSGPNPIQYDFNHMMKHVQSLLGLLEKIDVNKVQQFLNSPFIRNILTSESKKE